MARLRRGVFSPTVIARRNAIYRGVLGGSRGWLVVGGAVWLGRFIRRTFGRTEEFAALEKLAPGQAVTIAAIAPQSRRDRRRAGRSS